MPAPEQAPLSIQFSTRYTEETVREVEEIRRGIEATLPRGAKIQRSDVIRLLVEEALEHRKKEAAKCETPP